MAYSMQSQYEKIHSFFKTTTESYDFLEWDGVVLKIWDENKITEIYKYKDLGNFIKNL